MNRYKPYSAKRYIDPDIDRQMITHFGTPAQIDALIREETIIRQ